MADVFISYARPTAAEADVVAAALRARGYDVWRDDQLPPHRPYAEVIEERLGAAKAVVVLWSAAAVKSEWVQAEADRARVEHKLVQVRLDQAALPMPFDRIHCVDLTGWTGDVEASGWRNVLGSVAHLVEGAPAPTPAPGAPVRQVVPARTSRRTLLVASGVAGAAALGGLGWAFWPKPRKRSGATLAVLPFENLSLEAGNAFLADGIAEEVLNGLQRVKGLRVIARTSSFALRDPKLNAGEIAGRLGADVLVQGSVREANRDIRVAAQLVDGKSGEQLWSQTFQQGADNLFALQDAVCAALVAELPRVLAVQHLVLPAARAPTDPQSFRNLLEARDLWSRTSNAAQQGREDEADAAETRALDIVAGELVKNPGNADALALKASIWIRGSGPKLGAIPRRERYEQGRAMTAQAVAANPDSADANALQGEIFSRFEYRWKEAEQDILRALEANPNHAEAHSQYAYHLSKVGRCVEALPHADIAARLDPLYINRRFAAPRILPMLGREDEAIAILRKMLAEEQTNFIAGRDLGFLLMGRRDVAGIRQVAQKLRTATGTGSPERRQRQVDRMEAIADGLEGRPERHRKLLAEFLALPPQQFFHSEALWSFAVETAAIGDLERAIDLFGQCIANGIIYQPQWLPFGHAAPRALADNPRFKALWTSDPRLAELLELRLESLRRRQFFGRLPDGALVRP